MPSNIENNRQTESDPNQKDSTTAFEIRDHITRDDVRAEPDKIFLFGDNLAQKGFEGFAKEMRGEANSIGIPTKKAPSNDPKSFFSDQEFDSNKKAIDEAFQKIPPDKTIVIPKAGLGTGLAQLPQKAPKTFVYLDQKLAEIGFRHPVQNSRENLTNSENKVLIQNPTGATPTAKRLLDLNNINTASLKALTPTEQEIKSLNIDPRQALSEYATRLRQNYKTDQDNFRDGMRILSDSLEKGEQITITCSCRNGTLCHADVVKMAVEKVNTQIKNASLNIINEGLQDKNLVEVQENSASNQIRQEQNLNPRTQKAINEILSFSENDRILEKINQTDGRNRSEQASYLNKSSQFIRDLYEHGGQVGDGYLIVPKENLSDSPVLAITTEAHAVERIGKILQDETKSKELAPVIVEYGNKISGQTADGETKLKVFGWIYESLEGKSDLSVNQNEEKPKFEEALEKISVLAEEMHSLEPLDNADFVLLSEIEKSYSEDSLLEKSNEILNPDEIYQEAIYPEFNEQVRELEADEKINKEAFERIDLNKDVPRIPADLNESEIFQLINETLPDIDRQLENGTTPKEILAPFNEAIWQSAQDNAQQRLNSIYQKQQSGQTGPQLNEKRPEATQSIQHQLVNIDLLRQNVIEIKQPNEFLQLEKEAINAFYRQQKQQIGNLLTKFDEVRNTPIDERDEGISLKKELKQIKETKPNFAYKLENSVEIVVGIPSQEIVEKRNFISSYINYQLEKPETRLRFENERYRLYAARLEAATNRDEIMKTSAEIRAENAELGRIWKKLSEKEKDKLPSPLTNREMQFLFTEPTPKHYTSEMTAIRLSYAHSGSSRRQMTESLLKGEIKPTPEAQKLIESLAARLNRLDLNDSLLATKHFFESLKNPNESLKYQNKFDHKEIYQKLPPAEKDFVYQRATRQKENLQYQLISKKEFFRETAEITRGEKPLAHLSQTEKSFQLHSLYHQALILGERIDSAPLTHSEIKSGDVSAIAVLLNNQPPEKLEDLAVVLQKSDNPEKQNVAEVIKTFAGAEISKSENKTTVSIKLPENRLVSSYTYRELLEKFYPDNLQENNKYKFENRTEKAITYAREKGQDEALKNIRDEIKSNVYQDDAPTSIIEKEQAILEKLDQISQFQTQGRNARQENERLISKYTVRASETMQSQKKEIPSADNQKIIVTAALGLKSGKLVSNKLHDQFLQAVQKEITISDFEKFTANQKLLNEMKVNIKNEFAVISENIKVLEENRIQISQNINIAEKEQNFSGSTQNRERSENKPISLRIFEKEFEKAERGLIRQGLKEKINNIEIDKNFDPKTLFSNDELAVIKSSAIEVVKEKLEPKELKLDNRKISPEASRQAFATYKQLERASQIFQAGDDKSKITEAFFKLDGEAKQLNQIRQDAYRNEKMALLREGVKTDLIDLLKKNPDSKPKSFEAEIKKILVKNINKSDFVKLGEDGKQASILSRQIVEKIEAKQISAIKENTLSADYNMTVSAKNPYYRNSESINTNHTEKSKDIPVITR